MENKKRKFRKNISLIGSAGVHYVCAILSINGLIALPTIRNTKGMDIVVLKQSGDLYANIQVKTSSRKKSFWPIGKNYKKWNGKYDYYVFVRYYDEKFEAFIESAERVINDVDIRLKEEKKRGVKEWAPRWYLPRNMKDYKNKWRYFSVLHRIFTDEKARTKLFEITR